MRALAIGGLVVVCGLAVGPGEPPSPGERAAVAAVLDALHDAASRADGTRYFDCFDPEAVFFGTDAAERWPLAEFRAYASQRFATGTGWTYRVKDRHVFLDDDRHTAWFDERLHNETYGECRGTGVLAFRGGRWRIVQYNLTMPIPNEVALDVVALIRAPR